MTSKTLSHYINGAFTGAGDALESLNPSDTSDVVARFPDGGAAEVDAAVRAAAAAQPAWAQASPEVRSDLLEKIASALFARAAELGELLAREEGKLRAEGMGEVLRAARIFRYFAGEAIAPARPDAGIDRPGVDVPPIARRWAWWA
jgi:alpha-ketoglutaric semialdehyde dehydrogenase